MDTVLKKGYEFYPFKIMQYNNVVFHINLNTKEGKITFPDKLSCIGLLKVNS